MRKRNFYSCCEGVADSKPPFEEILIKCLSLIAKGITSVVFRERQTLFYQGHMPYGLFVVKEGDVRLTKNGNELKWEDTLPVVLGWTHLLRETPYCATCVAKTDVHALFLPKEPLLAAFRKRGIDFS